MPIAPLARVGTRELMLDAAERLYAQKGIRAVSLREIALAANQRNNGAAQYHFGDAVGLIRAVYVRRGAVVNERREALLDECLRRLDATLVDVLRCYVAPLGEQVTVGNWYVPFLARLQADHERDELLSGVGPEVTTAYERVRRRLQVDELAGLPRRVGASRWRLTVNLAIDALADHQFVLARSARHPMTVEELVDDLAASMAGFLTAPTPLA